MGCEKFCVAHSLSYSTCCTKKCLHISCQICLECVIFFSPEDTEPLKRFFTIKNRSKFKKAARYMITIMSRYEFEEIFCYMRSEMSPILRCIMYDSRLSVRKTTKTKIVCKRIRIRIKIPSSREESSNRVSNSIESMNFCDSKRAWKENRRNSVVANVSRYFFDDILRKRNIARISP